MVKAESRSKKSLRVGALAAVLQVMAACSTDSHKPLFAIELEPSEIDATWSQQYEDLDKVLADDPSLRLYSADLVGYLKAQVAEERLEWDKAAGFWLDALKNDAGAVGKIAFQRWSAIQIKVDPATGGNPEALARILLAETDMGNGSPWLKKQNLTDKTALVKRLQAALGQRPIIEESLAPLPTPDGFEKDLLWTARSKAVCGKSLDSRWVNWVNGLSRGQVDYWKGLQASCENDPTRAAGFFRAAIPELSASDEDKAQAIRAADLLIQSYKANGNRIAATEAYQIQSNLLKRDDLPLGLLEWTPFEQQKRLIESLYWVGRNRAMQGDYERAKIAVHEGLDRIASMQSLAKSAAQVQSASELQVDGQHILASRVFYEQLDFQSALSLNRVALQTAGLSTEWRQRLLWSEGWYQFRKGNKALAVNAWDVFLKEKLEDSLRTKALYWKGRALWELGEKDRGEEAFLELRKIAPLSFYAVVGVPLIDKKVKWSEEFKRVDDGRLSKIDDFEWGAYKDDAEAMRRFRRLELVLAVKLKALQDNLSTELFERITAKPKLIGATEPSLYASRLFHMAQQYLLSISLTSQISQTRERLWNDYPEQLLIFFPKPFEADVRRFAQQNFLEPELVWGLSRQESSFNFRAGSPAGALGLMQLMPNTAQELAQSQGVASSGIHDRLRQPALNLQLGTLYLSKLGKRYQNQWPRAIAAYNAGEYVVDAWILRRDAPDLIEWAEGLSFGETSSYVKNVWRNWEVYRWLR